MLVRVIGPILSRLESLCANIISHCSNRVLEVARYYALSLLANMLGAWRSGADQPAIVRAPQPRARRFRKCQTLLFLPAESSVELVLATVGRFWRARGELCAISPVRFREPAPPGTAKAAWNFVVGRCSDGTTELRTETRVLCADVEARRRFRAYWMLIKPFSGLIRCEMLAAVRSAAETD